MFVFYRTLSWTWRVRLFEPESLKKSLENKNPVVLAHWHGDELALLSIVKRYRIATIASQSKDGELMATVLKWMGAKTSRGSSSRGSVQALKGLLRLVKDGGNCSFAVDGPKGPLHKVKPGVFELSRMIHGPIYAAGVYVDRAIYFPRSWNKTFLPKPFAKVIIVWSESLPPVTKEQDPRNPDLALELESLLHQTRQQAVNFIADNKA
ncbi:lysophospholipid acyltransferase family protein [Bdellovibrio sp. HCB185ZH]|uniref:lysophospholipid acyltransferase family protein n=1 Tax=Bdellovibrio sp. HCB185ZH TaxID=3394235 RepID=UPI0039A67DAD